MASFLQSRRAAWIVPTALLVIGAIIVLISPAEETLGNAVKIIYVHVAFIRAGEVGFYLGGVLGAVVLVMNRETLSDWMRAAGWAALGLYFVGLLISVAAQLATWGGIAWQEPRMAGALNLLAVAALVQGLNTWLPSLRGRGVLRIALAGFQLWTVLTAVNVLHPQNAIGSSGSLAIELTGIGLTLLAVLLGGWITWLLRQAFAHRAAGLEGA